jgi:hypothetical protein
MKAIAIALLLALPASSYADLFYKDYVYKCVKDGKVTYQEMPCGWSALGKDEQKGTEQVLIPFSEFCSDKTISEGNILKKKCPHFSLPNEAK